MHVTIIKIMKRKLFSKIRAVTSLQLIVGLFLLFAGAQELYAAALTSFTDTMSRLNTSTLANQDIQFTTPTGVASGETIKLTFQSDFTLATLMGFADMDLLDDGVNVTLADATAGATWGVATTSSTITFTNGTTPVVAGSVVRIKIGTNATNQSTGTRQITNPTTTGNKTISVTGTFTDTGTTTVNMLSNDQVALTALVTGSITFSISSSTASFGTLSASAARFATSTLGDSVEVEAHNLIIGTNATNGYTATVKGFSLTSGANTIATSSSNTASTVGSEQFGLRAVASGSGSGAVSAPYAAAGYAFATDGSSASEVAAATASTANNTFSVRYIANIASNTEAGAYSTTLTYIATANF
jgi:hypothetical protein